MSLAVHIRKSFGTFSLDISFSSDQKRIGILGASGSGKSMTLKCIAGIVRPDEGEIALDGRTLFRAADRVNLPPQKRRIGYLFQNYALFPNMTVEENVEAGLRALPREERRERAARYLRKFALTGLEHHFPDQLSGGQQQRTALARILVCAPEAILLDEPFSALDTYLKSRLQEEMAELLEDYAGTVVIVSHSSGEICRFAKDLVVIDSGRAVAAGPVREVFSNPRVREAAALTGCRNFTPVRRLDAHTFTAVDWGVTLRTKRELPEDFSVLGVRETDWVPVYGEKRENCLSFTPARIVETPDGAAVYLRPREAECPAESAAPAALPVWSLNRSQWEETAVRGFPSALQIPEERMLFLGASEKPKKIF